MIRELDRKPQVHANVGDTIHEFEPNSRDPERCRICDSPSESLFQKNGYQIRDCLACGHRFAELAHAHDHVERVYADDYFRGGAAGYADYLADQERLVSHGKRYARVLNRHMSPGKLLDIGAAAGFILKGFIEMGWSGVGIEPNSLMAEYARRRLGVMVETGNLENNQLQDQYDLITMIQVVPHFVDPRQALEVASNMTKPGGYWLIETWNRNSWTARILGEAWHEYSPPSVLHWFSIETLRELVQDLGLQEVARGRPTKWISPSHAQSIARGELDASLFGKLVAVAARFAPTKFSLPYVFDDIFWALYRKPNAEAAK